AMAQCSAGLFGKVRHDCSRAFPPPDVTPVYTHSAPTERTAGASARVRTRPRNGSEIDASGCASWPSPPALTAVISAAHDARTSAAAAASTATSEFEDAAQRRTRPGRGDRKSTRLNSSHDSISYA